MLKFTSVSGSVRAITGITRTVTIILTEARKKWNGDRFMNDPTWYNDNKLIRPYRVGVACGSCHIAPNPSNPPLDAEIRAGKI
jgi:hypothetical protein